MNLELLANELLLDLFEYFHAVELLRSFHGLNTRFDELIFIYLKRHRLDFQNASRKDFETVCKVNLPLIIDHVVSLGLSDDDEIPQQIYLFRSYGWNLNRFQQLRSLSFDHIRESEIISGILSECPQIIHLNLNSCYFNCTQDIVLQFMNTVWSLPKLANCYLKIVLKYSVRLPIPTEISLSMKHLVILGVSLRNDQFISLCQCTPSLQYLAFEFQNTQRVEKIKTPILSITELNLVFIGLEQDNLENVLQNVPNLHQLKIETLYLEMDGFEWEQLISNHLLKLKNFQLKMRFPIRNEKRYREILKSFQTRFWLEENQWFIRYHNSLDDDSNMVCLYTLPYSFSYLDILFPIRFKSTGLNNDENYLSYDNVQHLVYRSFSTSETLTLNFNFPNVTCLSITLPISNHVLLMIQKLDRLTKLEVSRVKTMWDMAAQLQLQSIIDCVPNLVALSFTVWREEQPMQQSSSTVGTLTPVALRTHSIRQVNLRGYYCWFNDDECDQLVHSSLGKNCEVLFIKVQNRFNIIYLINSMHHLRTLIVQSRDDNWTYSSSIEDQHVQWLQENLPPMCSIKRDRHSMHNIRIWIHS